MAKLLEMAVPREGLEPVEDVVVKLASLLHRAETGEVRNFAYAAAYCDQPTLSLDQGIEWGRFGDCPDAGLVGGLEAAKAEAVEVIRAVSTLQEVEPGLDNRNPRDPAG